MNAIRPNPAARVGRGSWPALLDLSTREVFVVMLGSQLAEPVEPFSGEGIDVTSMVGLAGEMCGVMSVRCSAQAAALMASKMLGVETGTTAPEMWDALGEICNMIAGDFKHKIAGLGDSCMLSVPTVISGRDYTLHSMTDSGKFEINLLFEGLPLIVALEIHE
jgi:chemotaxis protein CheX